MTRYVTRPRALECGDDVWAETAGRFDVIVTEDGPHDTGLCDASGHTIYRMPERQHVGFKLT